MVIEDPSNCQLVPCKHLLLSSARSLPLGPGHDASFSVVDDANSSTVLQSLTWRRRERPEGTNKNAYKKKKNTDTI